MGKSCPGKYFFALIDAAESTLSIDAIKYLPGQDLMKIFGFYHQTTV
jgi:hypothetical protein